MLKKTVIGALFVSNILAAPLASASMHHSSQSMISLRAFVPVVCRTTFTADYGQVGDIYQLGTVNEFCNSARGYRVIVEVDGSPDDAGTIYFGGQAFPVTSDQIVVTDVNGPGRINRTLDYQPGDTEISQLRIRIEPKYA